MVDTGDILLLTKILTIFIGEGIIEYGGESLSHSSLLYCFYYLFYLLVVVRDGDTQLGRYIQIVAHDNVSCMC